MGNKSQYICVKLNCCLLLSIERQVSYTWWDEFYYRKCRPSHYAGFKCRRFNISMRDMLKITLSIAEIDNCRLSTVPAQMSSGLSYRMGLFGIHERRTLSALKFKNVYTRIIAMLFLLLKNLLFGIHLSVALKINNFLYTKAWFPISRNILFGDVATHP